MRFSSSRKMQCAHCKEEFSADCQESDGYVISLECLCYKCLGSLKSEGKQEKIDNYHKAYAEQLRAWVEKQVRERWEEHNTDNVLYADMTLEQFDKTRQLKAFETVSSYDWDADPAKSLVLFSPNCYGVGKTHLAKALVWKMIAMAKAATLLKNGDVKPLRCPVCFQTETLLLARIRATFNPHKADSGEWNVRGETYHETDDDIYNELEHCHLLIIDDVGKVRPKDSSFLQGVYYRIIDSRYIGGSPIMLTTNLDAKQLEAHIGGACADRLFTMCGPANFVKMIGKSYRREHGIGK